MNGSPLAAHCTNSDDYTTPSRKPSQHHCNAGKKQKPFVEVDPCFLDPIKKNLFGDLAEKRNAKEDRKTSKMISEMISVKKIR